MSLNEPGQRGKQEPKIGARINIVEDEDYALLLDSVAETPASAATPTTPTAAATPPAPTTPEPEIILLRTPDLAKTTTSPEPLASEPSASSSPAAGSEPLEPEAATSVNTSTLAAAKAGAQSVEFVTGSESPGRLSAAPDGVLRLPLIGHHPLQKQVRILLSVLGVSLVLGAFFVWINLLFSGLASNQTQIAGDALMHSQRIGKATPNAIAGNGEAFKQLDESRKQFNADLELLFKGGSVRGLNVYRPSASIQKTLNETKLIWDRTDLAAGTVLKLKGELSSFGSTLQKLNSISPVMLDLTEQISTLKIQNGGTAREIAASSQLGMLTQRLARGANDFLTAEGVNPETAFLLGKDVNTFRDIVEGFLRGSELLRLTPTKEGEARGLLLKLDDVFDEYRKAVSIILGDMPKYIAAKQSEQLIFSENETLRDSLSTLQQAYRAEQDAMHWSFWLMLLCVALALVAASGTATVLLQDSRHRAKEAEQRRHEAEIQRALSQQQEADAKAANDQTQRAILRLMNELQEVADGDLTVQATVSEDMTGAIADSINYTVEELRGLVGRVTVTAQHVTTASNQAQGTSNSLLAAAHQQSRDIQETGQAVMAMVVQITDVSRAAIESAEVARLSVAAADEGALAVGKTILGMNEIREQIQETSKRIKRLGESSQEIGEITELISDITEQTNVLALNAAIQAASAGEAGRGFSIVAEEVQRLAERSGEATKQIGLLVRAIQADTHDAVAAMEKSTHGVVEGARLSDAAGAALADIRRVSNRLAELIHGISAATEQQATSANGVASNIQHILNVTERTQEGTQQTAQSIRELAGLAQELRDSVARFRVAA